MQRLSLPPQDPILDDGRITSGDTHGQGALKNIVLFTRFMRVTSAFNSWF